jgi:acetyltransferase-like isoleucine patch superfamily enzyme
VQPSDRAPGLLLGENVQLAEDVQIGAYVVIHPNTVVGAGCVIQDRAILGKPPKLAAHSSAPREVPPGLVLSPGAVVCAGAVVFAGAELGEGAIVGDQAFVRERAIVGPGSVVGRGSAIDNDVTIAARVRIQTDVYITAGSVIEEDVFVGPGVTTTNDSTMARHAPDEPLDGPTLRRACRVGGGVTLCPGVEIGEEAFIAAGAVVAADIPARGVAMGVPARVVREVPEGDLIQHWR